MGDGVGDADGDDGGDGPPGDGAGNCVTTTVVPGRTNTVAAGRTMTGGGACEAEAPGARGVVEGRGVGAGAADGEGAGCGAPEDRGHTEMPMPTRIAPAATTAAVARVLGRNLTALSRDRCPCPGRGRQSGRS